MVRHEHKGWRASLAGELVEENEELCPGHGIEAGARLVKDEQAWPGHERTRDEHALTLALRQVGPFAVHEASESGETEVPASGDTIGARARVPEVELGVFAADDGIERDFGGRDRGGKGTRHDAEMHSQFSPVVFTVAAAEHSEISGSRGEEAGERLEQGRLAAAVGSENHPVLAGRDTPVETAQDGRAAAFYAQTGDFEDEFHHPRVCACAIAPVNRVSQCGSMRFLKLLLLVSAFYSLAQARPFMVVAYNVENLFDLDGVASYEDYQPSKYTRAHALTKLQNVARVVARFEGGRGPDVLMLCELEVDATPGKSPPDYDAILARYAGLRIDEMLGAKFNAEIGDLPSEVLLAKALADAGLNGYHIVIGDSTPAPGERKQEIKCAIFTRFPVKQARSHSTPGARAILEVQVDVDGAPLYLFANHWKSGAGDAETEKTRAGNARTLRTRLDEILRNDPNADIVIGGDLNSQYNQKQRYPKMKTTGINDVLGSQGNELAVRGPQRDLYNLWFELPPAERGSDTYRGEWGTLMHLIISRGLYDFRGVQYVDNSFAVGKFAGLNANDKGEPVRWAFDGPAGHGFSDHFPVAAKFVTVADNRADKYLPLRNASAERASETAAAVKIDYTKIDLEKVAVFPAKLPPGTNLRADAFKGKIVSVEGKVAKGTRLAVEFAGETYDIHSFDEGFRKKLRADYKAGDAIKFYGEIGQYRERWQFIIRDPSWVK